MHSFARHRHRKSGKGSTKETRGLILNGGWRYDLQEWFLDTFLLGRSLRHIRQRTAHIANLQIGETVLDVGCGTGTLALEAQQRVGTTGHVFGIDPGTQQIARARSKAARRHMHTDFQIGVIEDLTFPDQSFDVVLSTMMMHHLSGSLKREGLAEICRVLKPGGRLIMADFKRTTGSQDQPVRFGSVGDLPALVKEAGFSQVDTEEVWFPKISGDVTFIKAHKD